MWLFYLEQKKTHKANYKNNPVNDKDLWEKLEETKN